MRFLILCTISLHLQMNVGVGLHDDQVLQILVSNVQSAFESKRYIWLNFIKLDF